MQLVIQHCPENHGYFQNRGIWVPRGSASDFPQIPSCLTLNIEFSLWKWNHLNVAGMWRALVQSDVHAVRNEWIVGSHPQEKLHKSVSIVLPTELSGVRRLWCSLERFLSVTSVGSASESCCPTCHGCALQQNSGANIIKGGLVSKEILTLTRMCLRRLVLNFLWLSFPENGEDSAHQMLCRLQMRPLSLCKDQDWATWPQSYLPLLQRVKFEFKTCASETSSSNLYQYERSIPLKLQEKSGFI